MSCFAFVICHEIFRSWLLGPEVQGRREVTSPTNLNALINGES